MPTRGNGGRKKKLFDETGNLRSAGKKGIAPKIWEIEGNVTG